MRKMKKKFKSNKSESIVEVGYYGDEGIYIRIKYKDNRKFVTHIFDTEDEVKDFISILVKHL